MVRAKSCFSFMIIAGCLVLLSTPAEAHMAFKKALSEKLPDQKINCNACHIDKQPKTVRNSFGKVFEKMLADKNLTAQFKEKSGADKKDFENDTMIPAFNEAFDKVQKMTMADMIKAGLLDGFEPLEEKK